MGLFKQRRGAREGNTGQITFYDGSKRAAGGVQIIGYYGDLITAIPNHSEITGQDDIAASLGNGKLVNLKMSSPAASGNSSEWTEIHIFIPTPKPNMAYDFWIMRQNRNILLDMLKDAHK